MTFGHYLGLSVYCHFSWLRLVLNSQLSLYGSAIQYYFVEVFVEGVIINL